jgi:hypothetical protein
MSCTCGSTDRIRSGGRIGRKRMTAGFSTIRTSLPSLAIRLGDIATTENCATTFANHVYIVTAGQVPSWLGSTAEVSIVDYRELAGSSGSLAFDSGNIESLIHHIPGLSERFFYLNDDIFFGAPVDTTWWFEPCLKVFVQPSETDLSEEMQVDGTAMVVGEV